jgi:hypothetical protein
MKFWNDESGDMKVQYRFGYNYNEIFRYLEKLEFPTEQLDFLRDLLLTYHKEQRTHNSIEKTIPDKTTTELEVPFDPMIEVVKRVMKKRENEWHPQPDFIDRINFRIQYLSEAVKSTKPKPLTEKYTHREYVLERQFLVSAGLAPIPSAKEMKEISSKRYNAYRTLIPGKNQKLYRPPKEIELRHVIELLQDSPPALALAQKALNDLLKKGN